METPLLWYLASVCQLASVAESMIGAVNCTCKSWKSVSSDLGEPPSAIDASVKPMFALNERSPLNASFSESDACAEVPMLATSVMRRATMRPGEKKSESGIDEKP